MCPLPPASRHRRYIPLGGAVLACVVACLSSAPVEFQTTSFAEELPRTTVATETRPILDALYGAMGGLASFKDLSTLHFTFSSVSRDTTRSSRTHWWDRADGRYRIQGKNRAGQSFVALFNTHTRDGDVWLDGNLLSGEERDKWLARAYGLFINDTYWLLMPLKLDDDGVRVIRDGEVVVNGLACDRLKVTFDSVGLTPGDTYWAYVDRASHRMIRWGFILEGDPDPSATESLWDWVNWQPVGPLLLSSERVRINDPDRSIIRLTDLEAGATWPDSIFTHPAPLKS